MKYDPETVLGAVMLFRIFNIEYPQDKPGPTPKGWRFKPIRKKKKKKKKKRIALNDNIRNGVTIHPPGSKERVADLAAFYAANGDNEISAFNV